MNKHHPGYGCMVAFVSSILIVICLLSATAACKAADASDLYQEKLQFDSKGNLIMTTHDKKASSGIKYRTIGWTIKRWSGNVLDKQYARIRLEQEGTAYADPADDNYSYSRFICGKDEIFERIGEASADWQLELYRQGGVVYLDAIMTVVENGKPLGWMDADGTRHGEVYVTAEGIMNARAWADPEGLRTHFNKAVLFHPIPEMIDPPKEIDIANDLRLEYGISECGNNEAYLSAVPLKKPDFDVTQAIPTGEQVIGHGSLQKYYYECIVSHYEGRVNVPVQLNVTYTYTEKTEKGTKTHSYTSQVTLYASRPYSYYRIRDLELYTLDGVRIENQALPDDVVDKDGMYSPRIVLQRNLSQYMEIPPYSGHISVAEGESITEDQLQAIAEGLAGKVKVRSDHFEIDGEVVLSGAYEWSYAHEPVRQKGARQQTFQTQKLTIPHTKRNDTYETSAWAIYRRAMGTGRKRKTVTHTNDVTVHTPVVCKGGITDDIAHNQQVVPTKALSLVLGRPFTVGILTYGTHRDIPGYGTRDYEKYVKYRQVRFPFTVYLGQTACQPDTWISLPPGRQEFYLPVGVREGDYRIRYRTIAKNEAAAYGGIDQNGYLANLNMPEYGAYDELTVTVMGRMYDLAITDIVDYPRWYSVFYGTDGRKKPFAYWIGRQNADGALLSGRLQNGIFPILPGDHPYNPAVRAVGLGYRIKLQVKTIGDMRTPQSHVTGIPTYYYIARDGSGRRRVRLYQKKDLKPICPNLEFTSANRQFVASYERNVADPAICASSIQVWNGEYQLSPDLQIVDAQIDLDEYIRRHGGRISQSDPVFYKDGYLLVSFDICSYPGETAHLSYENALNSGRGYCNMWQMQGFLGLRTDQSGKSYSFADGDCLLYDIRYNLHTDYESWGTH